MKYIYLNDIEYLIKKRKKLLIAMLLIPLLIMLINIKSSFSLVERLVNAMGTNWISFNESNMLEFIMYLFNISIYVFLIVDIYVKDIAYGLDNIFLRIHPKKWFLKKSIIFISLVLILKLLQYGVLIFTILLLNEVSYIGIFKLITYDFIYVVFIDFLFITAYIVSATLNKNKIIPFGLFLVIIILMPKNIYNLKEFEIGIMFLTLILCLGFSTYLFNFFNKNIIQNI